MLYIYIYIYIYTHSCPWGSGTSPRRCLGRVSVVFVGFPCFNSLFHKFAGISSEFHRNFTGISLDVHQIHRNFTGISPEFHQNSAMTSNRSTFKKGRKKTQLGIPRSGAGEDDAALDEERLPLQVLLGVERDVLRIERRQ